MQVFLVVEPVYLCLAGYFKVVFRFSVTQQDAMLRLHQHRLAETSKHLPSLKYGYLSTCLQTFNSENEDFSLLDAFFYIQLAQTRIPQDFIASDILENIIPVVFVTHCAPLFTHWKILNRSIHCKESLQKSFFQFQTGFSFSKTSI